MTTVNPKYSRQKENVLLLSLCLLMILSQGTGASSLRNEMPPYLQSFQQTVEKQAKAFPATYIVAVETEEKIIHLTFDDGPHPVATPKILDILKAEGVTATFFVLGSEVKKYPEITKRIVEEGHALGNHSLSHPDMRKFKNHIITNDEFRATSKLIEEITGLFPKMVRPPYGALRDDSIEFLEDSGWKVIQWSIDSFDWDPPQSTTDDIVARLTLYHHPGAIVLMHCSGAGTVAALPKVIKTLRELGYEFRSLNY